MIQTKGVGGRREMEQEGRGEVQKAVVKFEEGDEFSMALAVTLAGPFPCC